MTTSNGRLKSHINSYYSWRKSEEKGKKERGFHFSINMGNMEIQFLTWYNNSNRANLRNFLDLGERWEGKEGPWDHS